MKLAIRRAGSEDGLPRCIVISKWLNKAIAMAEPSVFQVINAVALLSDAYGGFGGIAKFNRDFCGALNANPHVTRTIVLPRLIMDMSAIGKVPETIVYDRNA